MREDVLRELAFYVSQTRIGLTQSPPCPPTLGENLLLTPPELGVQGAFAAIGSNICVSPIRQI